MKIVAVCGAGMGSSMIGKINIENILRSENISADVSNIDIGSLAGVSADFYVTTEEMFPNFPSTLKDKTIIVDNFINVESMKKSILQIITK